MFNKMYNKMLLLFHVLTLIKATDAAVNHLKWLTNVITRMLRYLSLL